MVNNKYYFDIALKDEYKVMDVEAITKTKVRLKKLCPVSI
jgi:hypothetical protein